MGNRDGDITKHERDLVHFYEENIENIECPTGNAATSYCSTIGGAQFLLSSTAHWNYLSVKRTNKRTGEPLQSDAKIAKVGQWLQEKASYSLSDQVCLSTLLLNVIYFYGIFNFSRKLSGSKL